MTLATTRATTPNHDQRAAEAFCDDLANTVEQMIAILNEEASEIRAARYEAALTLADKKSALAGSYSKAIGTLRAHGREIADLAPSGADRLRALHSDLETALQSNMTVLSAARTVSETLLRDLTRAATSRQQTNGYGSNGQIQSAPAPAAAIGYNAAT
ncbi:MAG: hypothetical protein AAFX39_14435 [Pseudomonadota bacterium]